MKPQTLLEKSQEVVTTGNRSNPNWDTLTDTQREYLTAAAVRDLGRHAHEATDEVVVSEAFNQKLVEALEEDHIKDRAVLCKELGEMLLAGAVAHCQKEIEKTLATSTTELAIARQFQNPRKQAIYNHPGL